MDYTNMLVEISNNQVAILDLLNNIDEGIMVLVFILSISFIYLFVRNLSSNK